MSGSNFTYYAGNTISIDGSNTISCDLLPVTLSPGFGINVTGSNNTFAIQNTKPAPSYQCIGSDGTQSTYGPDTVTNLIFQNFTNTFASNTLTLTPEAAEPYVAGDGIQVSGLSISNTKPMCDVAYFDGATETVIPGEQITALKFPQEQMTYIWQPSSGVLQMYLPTPSSGGSDVDVRVNGYTYPAGSFNLI